MKYKCKECGTVFREKPLEHGIFIVNFTTNKFEPCHGKVERI